MQRIAIFGSPGSGKSTLARYLSAQLTLPITHLDTLYFNPGWLIKPASEFRSAMQHVVNTDSWITDGNFLTESIDMGRIDRADTLILLYAPRWHCLWRVVRRSMLHYGKTRPDMATGCAERFDWDFWLFVWSYPAKAERIRQHLLRVADHKTVYLLTNAADIRRFLAWMNQTHVLLKR